MRHGSPMQQYLNERGALSVQYAKASRALAGVQISVRAEWPDQMKRNLNL